MFGIGTTELILIGIVALIVVGPKDLPGMFRALGQFTGKARSMAREFSRAMEDAADQAGMKDVNDAFRTVSNPAKSGMDALKSRVAGDKADGKAGDGKPEVGPETARLSEERAEAARKIRENAAKMAEERKARAAAEAAEAPETAPQDAPAAAPAKTAKPVARKATPKKAATTKAAPKKAAPKKSAGTGAKKPAARKTASKTATKPAAPRKGKAAAGQSARSEG